MAAKLKPAIETEYLLPVTDKYLENDGEPTKIRVAQATTGQHDQRMKLWEEFSRSFDEDGLQKITQRISPAAVREREVLLTMKACDLEDEDGNPLFKFPLEEKAFRKAWALLPTAVSDEIHSKVLLSNPLWAGESGEDL